MIKAKVCILGAFSVGKTSLVSRTVHSIFSERYLTTVGVKIDKKVIAVGDTEITLVLWDLYGEDSVQTVHERYLRGSAGYVLVVDGTRPETLAVVERLQQRMATELGELPFVLLLNKSDLEAAWRLDDHALAPWRMLGCPVFRTSARSGDGVEEAFAALGSLVMERAR